MAVAYLPPYVIEPEGHLAHTHTIILLHGRSSTAKEFATDLFSLSGTSYTLRSRFPTVRWVFPDAGQQWCSAFKEKRSAWFDTFSLDDLGLRQDLQVPGLRNGIDLIRKIVEEEVERLNGKAEKVILGGFSQGSATALWSLLTGAVMTKGPLRAFVGLGVWMPFAREVKEVVETAGSLDGRIRNIRNTSSKIIGAEPLISLEAMQMCLRMPVYLGHGTDDAVISVTNCHRISSILASIGAVVEAREYLGAEREGHWVKAPEQVDEIVEFLTGVLEEE